MGAGPRVGAWSPHRLALTGGALVLLFSTVAWLGSPRPQALQMQMPMLLLTLGVLPLFFTGLLFTTGLAWLSVTEAASSAAAKSLRGPIRAQWAGAMVLGLAGLAHDPALARVLSSLGLATVAAGWGRCVLRFVRLLVVSRVAGTVDDAVNDLMDDKRHASLLAVAGALGAALMLLAAGSVAAGDLGAMHGTVNVALWAFAGIFCATVSHRLLTTQFTSGPATGSGRAPWLLGSLVTVLGFQGLVHWAPVPLALQAGVEALAGLGWIALALVWALRRGLRQRWGVLPLLGLACLGAAMLWAGIAHGLQAAGQVQGLSLELSLGILQACVTGFIGSTLLAAFMQRQREPAGQNARPVVRVARPAGWDSVA